MLNEEEILRADPNVDCCRVIAARSPGGTTTVFSDPTLVEATPGGRLRPWTPVPTPVLASPASPAPARKRVIAEKSRRSLISSDSEIETSFYDSGSDGGDYDHLSESDEDGDEDEVGRPAASLGEVRDFTRRLREDEILSEGVVVAPVNNFQWSEDFSIFKGRKEVYSRVQGPTFYSQDPAHIFKKIWDDELMSTVVKETNDYAWQVIAQFSDPDFSSGIPAYLEAWTEVTVDELYRYLAMLVHMSFCHRSQIRDYWICGDMGLMGFRKIMSRNRFLLIGKFLSFVSNLELSSRGNDRKIHKIKPVLDHCNRKFAELYTPSQHLSLDESLLLWKGRLSWKQCIRSKAARFGIKTFELCESATGYLLQCRLYTGKQVKMHPDTLHGFQDHTAKVVLDLIDGYLDAGHVLVMDNWYNQLPLTRYLKTHRTDVLGTLNRRRQGIPPIIKELNPKRMARGSVVSRHSGDITLVAWNDVKLVTVMSTYHDDSMVTGRRAGKAISKPVAVGDYNKHMGGVDLKDQKISMYLMERKRCRKWYIKVFLRLLNTSILNAYIIYTKNPTFQVLTHRNFRSRLAEGLLRQHPASLPGPSRAHPIRAQSLCVRLKPGKHFPIFSEALSGARGGYKRRRCVRCLALKRRADVRHLCLTCKVPLCVGKCWIDYHTLDNLNRE